MAQRRIGRSAREKVQALPEPRANRGRREHLGPRRRQLDGQGQTIETRTNLDDGFGIVTGQDEVGPDCRSSLQKQGDGGIGHQRLD